MSAAQGYVYVDADARTVGDIRKFVEECDRLSLRDDTVLADELSVQITVQVTCQDVEIRDGVLTMRLAASS